MSDHLHLVLQLLILTSQCGNLGLVNKYFGRLHQRLLCRCLYVLGSSGGGGEICGRHTTLCVWIKSETGNNIKLGTGIEDKMSKSKVLA